MKQVCVISTVLLVIVNLSHQKCTPEFVNEFLSKHNEFRTNHGVAELVLDERISVYAQSLANYLALIDRRVNSKSSSTFCSTGKFEHRHKYGQNVYMSWSSDPNVEHKENGDASVTNWYSEIDLYSYFGREASMHDFSSWGHFTQVIWKGSKSVGVGCATKGNAFYVVANYDPHGNVVGTFIDNVLSLLEK